LTDRLRILPFKSTQKKERVGRGIKSQLNFVDSLNAMLTNTQEEYADLTPPETGDSEIDSDPSVKRATDKTREAIKKIGDNLSVGVTQIKKIRQEIDEEYKSWETQFKPVKEKYDAVVKTSGGTQIHLDQNRKRLLAEVTNIESALGRLQGKASLAKGVGKKRKEIINQLEEAYKAYFRARKQRCEYFTSSSGGTLKVEVEERKDPTVFRRNLLSLKRGSWLRDEDIERISTAVSPKDFVSSLLGYEWLARAKQDPLKTISDLTGIAVGNVEKLAEHLLDECGYKKVLSLLHTSVPADVPSISYKVGEEFKDLSELSVGQKAVALLIIAFSDGTFPVVIDQPEDSLDLRSIWDDVCQKLRGSKEKRQFIFTTHNSSVAVASDTDKFTVLQATADQGQVLYSGSINRPDIKKEVIDYLEGGKDTYLQKRQKYNL